MSRKPKKKRKYTRRKHRGKWGAFTKYLLIVIVVSALFIFLFMNRHTINKTVIDKVAVAKEALKLQEKKKSKNKKLDVGYSKEAREDLEALIHEEAKND